MTTILVNKDWCKQCGICAAFCPKKVFDTADGYPEPVRVQDCIGCGLCQMRCPDFAMTIKTEG